jgi:hypothetical protein
MNESAQLALTILVAGLLAGGGGFLGTYLREKGKNLATREDLEPIVRGQETIKQQLAHSAFIEGRRWDLKREISWELLSHLSKAQVSLSAQSAWYIEPGSEQDDYSEQPGFAKLGQAVSVALRAIEELTGPSELFLPDEAVQALRNLAVEEWHAGYGSGGDYCGYINTTLELVRKAQATVLAAAKAELAPPR